MKRLVQTQLEKLAPHFHKGGKYEWAYPLFEFPESFLLPSGEKTKKGAHVRDPADLKRMMMFVIFALVPATLFGMWNVGMQGFGAEGVVDPGLGPAMLRGAWHVLPIIAVSYMVGGLWEMLFCVVRKHEVNEGFLVTGLLFPLTLPPSIPLWMVALGISFGVVIGKEVFGGTGMNVLNPALTARAFVFFTYPAVISGAKVWDVAGTANPLTTSGTAVDGYTGATPLLEVASAPRGADPVQVLADAGWSFSDLAIGFIPGSIGEVSAVAALVGALFLVITGLASWRIMVGAVLGLVGVTALLNLFGGDGALALMSLPPHYHLVMGGFAFGVAFMATDPVTGAVTPTGRWIYGALIGVLTGLVRVVNPAYPEGMMLAILFMNVFAPLIDHFVVQRGAKRRAARLAAAA